MAVVFSNVYDATDLNTIREALNDMLEAATLHADENNDLTLIPAFYRVAQLINEMSINLEQADALNDYFGIGMPGGRKAEAVTRECTITY